MICQNFPELLFPKSPPVAQGGDQSIIRAPQPYAFKEMYTFYIESRVSITYIVRYLIRIMYRKRGIVYAA